MREQVEVEVEVEIEIEIEVECGGLRGRRPSRESPFRIPESGEAAPSRRAAAHHPSHSHCCPPRSGASSLTLTLFSAAQRRPHPSHSHCFPPRSGASSLTLTLLPAAQRRLIPHTHTVFRRAAAPHPSSLALTLFSAASALQARSRASVGPKEVWCNHRLTKMPTRDPRIKMTASRG